MRKKGDVVENKPFLRKKSFTKRSGFSFSTGFLFSKKKKCKESFAKETIISSNIGVLFDAPLHERMRCGGVNLITDISFSESGDNGYTV